jgi:hypothetical protein
MNASLLEMVLAIALSGMIFASALIPVTQTLVKYQDAQLDVRNQTAQSLAVTRVEQLSSAVWRDPNAPTGGADLLTGESDQIQVGSWSLRINGSKLEQQPPAGSWATIATPVNNFAFDYLMDDGTWTDSPDADELDSVLALRYDWTDSGTGLPFGGGFVLPDHAFLGGVINLDPPVVSQPYHRSEYTRALSMPLGTWP